ncbi:MAG TPA: molybdopterin-dependent oxidoreductase [Symbiobacteriaceae bacterium]|nr:molybdopterin-dependent oxidoreductase [Symbiobacteriaceae bacterium]
MTARRLARLHTWNGWNLLFLFVSGVVLYLPALRSVSAPVRTPLKYLHIASGLLSVALLAGYLPAAREHWERLRQRVGQKANVVLLAALLVGWAATGVLLWFNRYMPEGLAEAALVWHDRLTWFALPWALAHAVTRYFKVRLLPVTTPVAEDRRVLLAGAGTLLGAALWGRLGGRLGLPGFEPPSAEAKYGRHAPIPEGAAFVPPPVSKPAVRSKGRFRVYTVVEPMPQFDARTWRFTVKGLVEKPLTLTWDEFTALPKTTQVSDFHCITGWSVYDVTWEGVRLGDLLDLAGVKPEATHVKFISGDGEYTDSVSLQVARMGDVILPWAMDGSPLPTALGGPVRLIIPEMYGYKSVKWLQEIELVAAEHIGYWENLGYPADAWLRKDGPTNT